MQFSEMGDAAILEEIGRRLRTARLNRNWTQAELADRVSVALRTLQNAEAGKVTTLETLVAILRGLGELAQLDQFLPDPPPSPVQLAKLRGDVRQRASRARKSDVKRGGWKWGQ